MFGIPVRRSRRILYIIVVTATTGKSWTENLVFCTDNEESADDFDANVTVELLV